MKLLFGLLFFNEDTPSCTKFIWCSYYRSLIDTLASEVKCLRVIERRDLSNERNAFKSKTIFYHKKTRLNPRARYKVDPEKKKGSVRDSYKADPEKKKASVRDSYNADIESKQSAKRQR